MPYAPDSVVGEWTIEPRHNSILARLAEMWQYRHLMGYFASRTLQSLYRRSSFGWIWMMIRVTAPIGLNGLVFGGALGVKSNDGTPYMLFFLCGQTCWTLFDRSLLYITRSMERNRRLISKVYFPRLILPVSAVSPSLLFLAILSIVLIGSDVYLRYHDGVWWIPFSPRLALAPLAVVLSILFAIAVGFWTSVLQARYRDIRYGIRYSMSFLIYTTSVVFPLSHLKQWKWIVAFNPMESAIELFRLGTLGTPLEMPLAVMLVHLAVIVLVGTGGIWFFNREEAKSVDKL
jgi:lipopolysaccharide transport system permease protein